MSIGIRQPVISSSSLELSRGFYAIFLFHFPHSTTFPLCVPLTMLPLNEARRSFDQGGPVQQLLPLLLHPCPLPPLLRVEWHSRTSWRNFSVWMLTLTLSVMSYVRWTLVLAALLDARLRWAVTPCLPLLWPLRMMMMEMLALLVQMRCLLNTLTLCHSWQKGGVVLDMRVVILRRRVIGPFC